MNNRLMISAIQSGSGKTLITCGILSALKDKIKVKSFKCGPDYIDPMFHKKALGVDSENLDSWFENELQLTNTFLEASKGYKLSIMEGAMGLYDGLLGTCEEGSAYQVAAITHTPIVLVVDAHGMGRSVLALIKGMLEYDYHKLIKGIILNRVSAGFYERLKELIESEIQVRVYGYFPKRDDLKLQSRHLGLVLPNHSDSTSELLKKAGEQASSTIDLEGLISLSETAPKITGGVQPDISEYDSTPLVLAVARDDAFCFYYEANLRMFQNLNVKIKYFSPIADEELPSDADGLLLGGGYPELYLHGLSSNEKMRNSIRSRMNEGLPTLAECGGFMYLQKEILGPGKKAYPMVNYLNGSVYDTGKSVRFGYISMQEKESRFLPKGARIKGHEFHYYDTTENGNDCVATKPVSDVNWECCVASDQNFLGFAHLYYPSAPEFVTHFVKEMRLYHEKFIQIF